MLFDTLNSALADINASRDYNLDHLINRYDIDCQYQALTGNIKGFSLPLTRTMFINSDLQNTDQVKAHELIHCLLDDSVEPLLETSMVNNSKIENRADWGGLYLMLKEYQSLYDVNPESFNIVSFCEQSHIPSKYEFLAASAAEQAFDITIPDAAFYK